MRRLQPLLLLWIAAASAQAAEPRVEFALRQDDLQIDIGGRPFARYVFRHDEVLRPFFVDVRSPGGAQVTRNFPPVAGQDATDHAAFHPGLWLAFGDLAGADFWRNKGAVRHVKFASDPNGGEGEGRFAVENRYEADGKVVCEEVCKATVRVRPAGYLIQLDSTFRSSQDFYFGDQEEMGLGVRVATPLAVQHGGRIANSDGAIDEKQVWGRQADWCQYSGPIAGRTAGIVLMPHPGNFRRSWFHARDYGLLVANPFGQQAFTKSAASQVRIEKGKAFRLRFGVLIFDGDVNGESAYRDYVSIAGTD